MGRYNYFADIVECPHCKHTIEVQFQADIGALEWRIFHKGEEVIDIPSEAKLPVFGHGPSDHNIDFWVCGLGVCPICCNDIWARVNIRHKKFTSITLLKDPPDDMYAWGVLETGL